MVAGISGVHLLVFVYSAVLIGVIFWTGFLKSGQAVL
jgi:hypothetical protein